MLPVVALVGRPNVGKSTIFNVLTRSRDALVHDQPGVTRDRHYGICRVGTRPFVIVDTGGLSGEEDALTGLAAKQVQAAVDEASLVLFAVDAREGLHGQDHNVLEWLRKQGKRTLLVVNKVDGLDEHVALADFARLGVSETIGVAAAHGRGFGPLTAKIVEALPPADESAEQAADDGGIRVAIVGRPNVGKSTLVNRLLGEERVITSEVAGTTRDPIRVTLERDGKRYTLIDTAGVRRRARVEEAIEKFSVIKTLQSIAAANVVVLLLDARGGVADQDATVLSHILESGRALVIAVNKWDGLPTYERDQCKQSLDRKLAYVDFAPPVFISALHGSGMAELMRGIDKAYASANYPFTSSELTQTLIQAYESFQPPVVQGRTAKLRYAHPGGHNPPTIVIHGSRIRTIPDNYRRFLEGFFRKRFRLVGTPIRIEFREGANPFEGRTNPLTERQRAKRQRLKHFVKRKK